MDEDLACVVTIDEGDAMNVIDYSMRDFKALEGRRLTVGRLREEAERRDGNLFVVSDSEYKRCCLADPERLILLAARMEDDDVAGETGLLDVLAQGQMCVAWDQPPGRVARLALSAGIWVVLVRGKRPLGLFRTDVYIKVVGGETLWRRIEQGTGINQPLGWPAGTPLEIPEPVGEEGKYPGDPMTKLIAEPLYCSGCEGVVPSCPCRRHPQANCGRRKVS